jgi:hypothetical protein
MGRKKNGKIRERNKEGPEKRGGALAKVSGREKAGRREGEGRENAERMLRECWEKAGESLGEGRLHIFII